MPGGGRSIRSASAGNALAYREEPEAKIRCPCPFLHFERTGPKCQIPAVMKFLDVDDELDAVAHMFIFVDFLDGLPSADWWSSGVQKYRILREQAANSFLISCLMGTHICRDEPVVMVSTYHATFPLCGYVGGKQCSRKWPLYHR